MAPMFNARVPNALRLPRERQEETSSQRPLFAEDASGRLAARRFQHYDTQSKYSFAYSDEVHKRAIERAVLAERQRIEVSLWGEQELKVCNMNRNWAELLAGHCLISIHTFSHLTSMQLAILWFTLVERSPS